MPLGVAFGLFVGKQSGVMLFSAAAVRLGFARKPDQATWLQFYGVALLTGVGFTMSLFIGFLAFEEGPNIDSVKIAVLAGSAASAISGLLFLAFANERKNE